MNPARDGIGIEPLYYAEGPDGVLCSRRPVDLVSTPGIDRRVDPKAVDCLLALEYIPAPLTIFRGVRKLPPGHELVSENGGTEIRRYWSPASIPPLDLSPEEYAGRLRNLLGESVRTSRGTGKPPGVWLSGGLDSSALVAMMRETGVEPIRTFSIGFEERSYDELRFARIVARRFGTLHEERIMGPAHPDLVRKVVGSLPEPLADLGLVSTFAAAELASKSVKSVFSGEGADELFAGYDCHVAARLDRLYRRLPRWFRRSLAPGLLERIRPSAKKRGLIDSARRFTRGAALPARAGHLRWRAHLDTGGRNLLYGEELKKELHGWDPLEGADGGGLSSDDLQEALLADLGSYLPDSMLMKAASMGTANSLEVRFPFLEDGLVEFACAVPAGLKLRGLTRKYILKKAMKDILPSAILGKRKEGFSVPMKHWLRGSLEPLLTGTLSEEHVRSRGLFQPAEVSRLIAEHLAGKRDHSHTLWAMMVLEIWLERYL